MALRGQPAAGLVDAGAKGLPAFRDIGEAVFGLCEAYRDRLRGARLVSNPGCYATSVLLPLIPLLHEGLIDPSDIVADAKSGATGAGRTPREDLLFCEVAENFSAYSPGRTHRHVGEIEAVLADRTGQRVELTFCPHLLPVKRGILTALYVKPKADLAELKRALEAAYDGTAFVHVIDGAPPRLSDVVETNDCRISVHAAAPGRDRRPSHRFLSSGDVESFRSLGRRLLGPELDAAEPTPWR